MFLGALTTLIAAIAAFVATLLVLQHAEHLGVIQTPNERSSHTIPTPSGGGVGIVLGGSIAAGFAALVAPFPTVYILVTAFLIAAIGFYDDRKPLPARFRLAAQLVLSGIAVGFGVSLTALKHETGLPLSEIALGGIVVLGMVYWINLFNFMDGIDGIAASQALFMACGAAVLVVLDVPRIADQFLFWTLLGLAAASLGFLLLNWPPAKIFMGDAGSTYLGFMIAILALLTIATGWLTLSQWAVLASAFVADASATLIRRLLFRERVFEAHRRHAYQVLSRRWGSHRKVTLAFIGANVVWALPLAYCAGWPGWGLPIAVIAYLPLIGLALYFGAGAPERPSVAA